MNEIITPTKQMNPMEPINSDSDNFSIELARDSQFPPKRNGRMLAYNVEKDLSPLVSERETESKHNGDSVENLTKQKAKNRVI